MSSPRKVRVELPRRPTTANETSAPSPVNSRLSRSPSRMMLVLKAPARPRSPVTRTIPTRLRLSRSSSSGDAGDLRGRLGDPLGHLADRLRIRAHRVDPLLRTSQARSGDHLHRPRDLVDVLDRRDAVLDFLLGGHAVTSSASSTASSAFSASRSASSSFSASSAVRAGRSRSCSALTRSDSPSSSGWPSSSKSGPKSSIISAIASPSASSSSSES